MHAFIRSPRLFGFLKSTYKPRSSSYPRGVLMGDIRTSSSVAPSPLLSSFAPSPCASSIGLRETRKVACGDHTSIWKYPSPRYVFVLIPRRIRYLQVPYTRNPRERCNTTTHPPREKPHISGIYPRYHYNAAPEKNLIYPVYPAGKMCIRYRRYPSLPLPPICVFVLLSWCMYT